MATAEQSGPAVDPRACGSAPEFVRDRLGESESPMGAIELSDEYGCTHSYMRDVLSNLASKGVIDRAATGRYVLADDSGEDTDVSLPSIPDDGIADVPAGTEELNGPDEMPTQEEYRQQHSESDDGSDDGSDSSELSGSDGNASASGGSDALNDSTDFDADGAASTPLPMNPKTLGTVLAVALGLWLAYRALGGDGEPEPEPDAEQDADATTTEPSGGLTGA